VAGELLRLLCADPPHATSAGGSAEIRIAIASRRVIAGA
jgi:hypothetical protein